MDETARGRDRRENGQTGINVANLIYDSEEEDLNSRDAMDVL